MFYYLEGTVAELLPYLAVIDCGGVGYACKTTNNTLSHLKKGQNGKVYTYLNVGEGVFDLYGFATQSELHTFRMLLGVSGVGPKAALAILSSGTPDALAMAIITGDEKTLTAAPGIGPCFTIWKERWRNCCPIWRSSTAAVWDMPVRPPTTRCPI